ncbi:hypothetical protein VTN00DRAFT_2295 [Thermoascus crustaceus]|uniref:uncharacterized protein n=1 Tax=Thermoascus crustaceus TaxID=5088 RepID=UPI003743D9D2
MAGAATAAYSADALTSPGSVNGSQQQWDFSVPIAHDYAATKTKSRSNSGTSYQKASRNHNINGLTPSRSSSQGSKTNAQEPGYLQASRTGRRDSSLTRAGGESGSARNSWGKNSINVMESADNYHYSSSIKYADGARESARYAFDDEDPDSANWIHRDKLARIESEELQQAAIRLQRQVRAGSKSSSRRGRSHDSHSNGLNGSIVTTPPTEYSEPWPNLRDEKRRPEQDEAPTEEERMNWDLRRPEEIAADSDDGGASKFYRNPGLKKSSSRIPILSASPLPISQEQVDPNQTTPPSGSRPVSRGAQAQSSPAKKTTAKSTPGSGPRKTSNNGAARKTPQPKSRTNGNGRPTTRAGDIRPTTAVNRPEGDPPWLATMYKPDPRLPPDQQILPTHARRMQQEQWEKEGKTPDAYDREFAPISIRPDEPPRVNNNNNDDYTSNDDSSSPEPENEEKAQEQEPEKDSSAWPLQAPKEPEPVTRRPSTNGTTSGYSTMPKVQNTPPIGVAPSPKLSQQPTSTQEPSEKDKKKAEKEKGCTCCIVM